MTADGLFEDNSLSRSFDYTRHCKRQRTNTMICTMICYFKELCVGVHKKPPKQNTLSHEIPDFFLPSN